MALRGATVDEAGDDAADRAGGRLYELTDGVIDESEDDGTDRSPVVVCGAFIVRGVGRRSEPPGRSRLLLRLWRPSSVREEETCARMRGRDRPPALMPRRVCGDTVSAAGTVAEQLKSEGGAIVCLCSRRWPFAAPPCSARELLLHACETERVYSTHDVGYS